MRCLIKLTFAVSIAVLIQMTARTVLKPGGPFDEASFIAEVALATKVRGVALDSPELVGSAQRLAERRQGFPFRLPNPLDLPADDARSQSPCSSPSGTRSPEPMPSAPLTFAMSEEPCAR